MFAVNRTRMTRIQRMNADLFQFLSALIRSIRVIRVLLTRTLNPHFSSCFQFPQILGEPVF